jgi:hypothetical protein
VSHFTSPFKLSRLLAVRIVLAAVSAGKRRGDPFEAQKIAITLDGTPRKINQLSNLETVHLADVPGRRFVVHWDEICTKERRKMNDPLPPRIRLPAALRLGCLTGLLAACAPAFFCSLAFNRLVYTVRHWVLSWDGPNAELSIGALLGGTTLRVSLDLQDHLSVTDFMQTLKTLESGWWWTIPLLTLLLVLLAGAGLSALSGIAAALYNWFGRRGWLASPSPADTR